VGERIIESPIVCGEKRQWTKGSPKDSQSPVTLPDPSLPFRSQMGRAPVPRGEGTEKPTAFHGKGKICMYTRRWHASDADRC